VRGGPGDLDDQEVVQAAEAQGDLHEPELSRLDPVRPDLGLAKRGPARLTPGKHVEEAAQRPAVRGTQTAEGLHGPPGRAGLGELPGSRSQEPLRAQLAAEGIDPHAVPAASLQVMHDSQLRTRAVPVHGNLGFRAQGTARPGSSSPSHRSSAHCWVRI
jgi:hypothetical protein